MSGPVIHIELVKEWKEHIFEDTVSFGAHEHLPLVQLLHINILVDGKIGPILFKKTLFPSNECQE